VIQLDEPWVETAPEVAARYALKAIDRAFAGVPGPTALHICFGYAQIVHDKSRGRYGFLEPLADSAVDQISIEAAQPRLDLGVLRAFDRQTIILGVLDLGAAAVESAEEVAARLRGGLEHVPAERLIPSPDCGMKYLSRRGRVRQAAGTRARRRAGPRRAGVSAGARPGDQNGPRSARHRAACPPAACVPRVPPQPSHAFSSRLSSLRKRQSVPSARSALGLDSIMPTSWRRSA
jgi:Cobalamin-independent synthase, Catalytic domain